ncbi:MAG: MerR family DNA-binding protein [Pyrinomonadaceae bacterium]|nr:MerR family DNA-binding protein [Pyrinomonadaceae bacterium]
MMTASVIAKRANVPLFTVRHYTRIGLLKPSRDLRNGYKMYSRDDVQRLRFIASAKELGFTLGEIEKVLSDASHGDSPCPMVREIVQRRIKENRQKIRELKRLQDRLEKAADLWASMKNSAPDGHSVCRLIESFSDSSDSTADRP